MSTAARRLLIAAIHHGEWQSAPGSAVLETARQVFQDASWQVDTIEVVEQPGLDKPLSAGELAKHRGRQRILERRWRTYLHQESRWTNLRANFAQAAETVALHLDPAYRRRVDRSRQIQAFVTDKHCRAMKLAAQQSVDWLLVLESDATLRTGAAQGLVDLAGWLPTTGAWFVDLAGGIETLDLQNVIERMPDANLVRLKPPVTNTACAYLVSRDLATYLLEYRGADPDADEWAIDWFVNAAFMAAAADGVAIDCARCQPRILDHGSFTGMTTSWRSSPRGEKRE